MDEPLVMTVVRVLMDGRERLLWLPWDRRLFSAAGESDRSLEFLRRAPQIDAAQIGFSHADYGAVRHAITVGFIRLIIVGVNVHPLSPLWAPYILINAGCALRVSGQTLTDFTAQTFPIAGASGLLDVLGLLKADNCRREKSRRSRCSFSW